MTNSTIREEAEALASNLASLWNGGRNVLDRLVAAGGDPAASPLAALRRLGRERVERLFADPQHREELRSAFDRLTRYLTAETWYERAYREDTRLQELKDRPVAYFCAEFGLASWFPMYSGGLGVLAGDVLKEASDMGLPFVGVGLFYPHGFFSQRLDDSGYQTEIYPALDPANLSLTPVSDERGGALVVSIPLGQRTVHARLWRLNVGRTPLYLLDTNVPENDRREDREITAGLYAGDQDMRVRQEIVLGIGGVRALRALGIEPGVCSMNEGHAAFLGLELLSEALAQTDFERALESTRARVVYTNHTVVPAGNDVFPRQLVERYLGPYAEESGIGRERMLSLGSTGSGETVSMAILAFRVSGKANAVSKLHAEVVPREWPGFAVETVTNGVHVPTWLGAEMTALLDAHVPDWRSDRPSWERIRDIPDAELRAARERQRRAMIEYVNRAQDRSTLDPDALTIVWARRFAEYKRAGLLASDPARLARLLGDSERPVQLVIAGKAHPRDEAGKRALQALLHCLEGDAALEAHFAFIPDYSLEVARQLAGGADVWLNTPRKPLEASGTSGMKSSDNGGLQLTVEDGWAAEVDWWGTGWGIAGRDDAGDAEAMYTHLEQDVVPSFYDRDATGIPQRWLPMVKNTMILTLSRYSARRMLLDYVYKLYLPLLEEQAATVTPVGP